MADLHVDFLGKRLAGPVVAASGTFGFGPEYAGIEDLRLLGGISGKGLTLNGQPGNEGERLYETPSGLMNSIGLQHFIDHELPAMRQCGTTVWANLGGHTIEENIEGVAMLCAAGVDFIELNISCPNVKQGGLAFGIRAQDASEVVSAVRSRLPVRTPSACATPSKRARSIWKSAARYSTTPSRACPAPPCGPSPCGWSGRPWVPSASRSWVWAAS